MQWCLKLDRNDIRFGVDFSSEFFNALDQHFHIAEKDEEVIVGSVNEHSMGPLPVYQVRSSQSGEQILGES